MVSKDFIFKKSVQGTGSVSAKSENCSISKIFHVMLHYFKKKIQHVGHKWVICWSHPDCSLGQCVKWVNMQV